MSGSDGNGDNYTGGVNYWEALGSAPGELNADVLNDPNSGTASWWDQLNTPENLARLNALKGGLTTLKPLADPNAANVARQFPGVPAVPPAGMHQGQGTDALQQYLQVLQARQQAMRSQFLPKTAGLLGG